MQLSPLSKRRLHLFQSNRRGYISWWIFLFFFTLTTCANLIANDKPLFISYKGNWFFPVVMSYPETAFGGVFETETDYKDPAIQKLIHHDGAIIWPLIHYSYQTINYALPTPAPSKPDNENFLGTDDQGRDVLARLIYGLRVSFWFGLALTIISSFIGVVAGALQGYLGGKTDLFFQRIIEIWSGLPVLMLLIILSSFVTPTVGWLLFVMVCFSWITLVGVVRAEFLKARNFEYVRAARALGVNEWVIMFRHVLPNAMVAILTFMPFILNGSITTLTSLDFLGFGLPPGSASLGELLAQGKNNMDAPWLALTGFIVVALMLSLLVFIGEAVRDACDPRKMLQ